MCRNGTIIPLVRVREREKERRATLSPNLSLALAASPEREYYAKHPRASA